MNKRNRVYANAFLSGFIFFGQYFDTSLTDLEGRKAKYRAGIHLDLETIEKGPILFVENETLIKDTDEQGNGFLPIQTNFKIGFSQKFRDFEIILMNECKHPVDGKSGGTKVQDYKLLEMRYHFK